ncbi:type I-C CRISPR-associated protein Cas5c [Streptomyces acidiscabies]|uniref:pre-crRNA processing endonuclease n=1 Tax=Streptomyces acidiscabies TaxID=42234 RepID=A0AAP6BMG2_9ACTN|nr:type I-C CRISPR-associated protein Cas5c [Streptomyces acidiscabies]MDX2967207.1 type I-C CRISPR-associated protein Cas5c [Streptomyces acidiscabies]MDX3026071.1 type I-C CRISPR-associated protein Cas5c [Streptomyces acidiscabies]MDX3797053.1 type I-C CRISPR-associated protein Cas5c [Streptomyces acidiscabies]GAQ51233.1 CRISPR-associated protein Cas5 [Streptomyces acidiscabies]GAV38331.1 CRISPR-associated protein Cas5 [Streptomyces acidiscabies]
MTSRAAAASRLAERRGNDGWVFPDLVVEVSGPLACFTRPELKVERVSYPVMSPSAAVGLLETIFWKPEFAYVVRAIEVLAPIEWMSVRRNEVKSVISPGEVAALRKDPQRRYDVETDRDQRNSMLLRDVHYRIRTQVVLTQRGSGERVEKYREQLRRRVDKGACFAQPFLGCREFSASFGPQTDAVPIDRDEELGVMLHSIVYPDSGGEKYRWFRAQLRRGILKVPLKPLGVNEVAMPASSAWRADGTQAG